MQSKLTKILGNKELTWLKRQAKNYGIMPDRNLSDIEQYEFLKEEIENHGHHNIVSKLAIAKKQIVDDSIREPKSLMKWFYENQSPRLFGAENRLFVVLIDSMDINQSWKMKRAFSLIEPMVISYLDGFDTNSLKEIEFTFKGKTYRSLADIIFVIKE